MLGVSDDMVYIQVKPSLYNDKSFESLPEQK